MLAFVQRVSFLRFFLHNNKLTKYRLSLERIGVTEVKPKVAKTNPKRRNTKTNLVDSHQPRTSSNKGEFRIYMCMI